MPLAIIYMEADDYFLCIQLATNTLERVAPLTHAVGNVLKRVFVIGFSILAFGKFISYTFTLLFELFNYSFAS